MSLGLFLRRISEGLGLGEYRAIGVGVDGSRDGLVGEGGWGRMGLELGSWGVRELSQ